MQKIETGISELLKRQPVTEQEKDAYIQDLQKALRLLLEEVRDLEEMVALLQNRPDFLWKTSPHKTHRSILLFALGWSMERPSISHRNSCQLRLRISAQLRGH